MNLIKLAGNSMIELSFSEHAHAQGPRAPANRATLLAGAPFQALPAPPPRASGLALCRGPARRRSAVKLGQLGFKRRIPRMRLLGSFLGAGVSQIL